MSNSSIKKGPTAKDINVDVLIIGSGTGMAAALAAHEKGLDCLIIEKTAVVGGSTARSGGASGSRLTQRCRWTVRTIIFKKEKDIWKLS